MKHHANKSIYMTLLAITLLATACSDNTTGVTSTTATTNAPTTNQVETTGATTDGFDLEQTVASFVEGNDGGSVALIVRNGTTSVATAGEANSDGDKISSETPFRVGSISKPFTAVMILQLVDEGAIDLDAPLQTYLPDTAVGADATIRSLLSHQSGIPNYTDQPDFYSDVVATRDVTLTPDQVLAYVADTTSGTVGQFSYSNTNYVLLGQLVEAVGEQPLNEALQSRVARPLGLANTSFVGGEVSTPADLAGGWSLGVSSGEKQAPYESIASSAWAAGALVSTATDLRTFMEGLFAGKLVSDESLAAMTDLGNAGHGFGLFAAQLGAGNPGYSHGGGIPGYLSTMGIAPESGDLLVVLTNNDTLIPDDLAFTIVTNW